MSIQVQDGSKIADIMLLLNGACSIFFLGVWLVQSFISGMKWHIYAIFISYEGVHLLLLVIFVLIFNS